MKQIKVRLTDPMLEALTAQAGAAGVAVSVHARVLLATALFDRSPLPTVPPQGPLERDQAGGPIGERGVVAVTELPATQEGDKARGSKPSRNGDRAASEFEGDFAEFWAAYPKRSGGNPKPAAFRAYVARRRAGVTGDELLQGAKRYAGWCEGTDRTGTEYVKQAQFWLSPRFEGWKQDWAVSEKMDLSSDEQRAVRDLFPER